jgi:hypothetical protein
MLAEDEIQRLLGLASAPIDQEEPEIEEQRFDLTPSAVDLTSLSQTAAEALEEEESGGLAIEDALAMAGVEPTRLIQKERSLGEEFGVGIDRGVDQTQALGYGLLGMIGQSLGVEGIEEYGLENYVRKMEEAAQSEASVRDPFEEIEDAGDAATYAAGLIGEQLPQLLVSAIGGGIGGFAAKTVAKKVVANEIGKRVAAGMAGREFASEAAKIAARGELTKQASKEVAEKVAQGVLMSEGAAATKGGIAGAYLANFGQIAGGSFGQIAQETGEGDAAAAAAFAVPGAALDTLGEVFIAGKFLKPFTKAGRAAAGGAEMSLLGRVARSVGVGLPSAAAIEGGTEYAQTGLEQAALGAADPNRTIEEVIGTPEAERERQIAATAGAVVGGGLGGAGSVIEALAPQTAAKLRQTTQGRTEEAPAEPGAALPGQWSKPVEVGGVTMRKSASGIWAAINPPEDLDPAAPRNTLEDGSNVLVLRSAAGEQNSWLIEEAESALSEVSEGQGADDLTEVEAQQIADDEDELGEDAELQELREGLAVGEEPPRQDLGTGQPIKSAEESARAIDDIYTEAERTGQSPFGALFQKKRADAERSRERKANDRLLQWSRVIARKPDETKQFIDGLKPGDRVSIASGDVGDDNFTETTGIFLKRRPSGNAVFKVARLSPRSAEATAEQRARGETLVGPVQRIDITPDKFNRISLAPPPESRPLVSPFEETMRELLGTNPDKRSAGQALGSPFTGAGAPQETTISNRMGSGPIPVLVRWFNKKGEKGTVIPTFKGKFTNSPLTTVFQMNEGLGVEVPDDQLADLNPDIQVESVSNKKGGRKNIVTAVNLWGRTYRRGKTPADFSVNEDYRYSGAEGQRQRDAAQSIKENPDSPLAKNLVKTDSFGKKTDARRLKAAKRGLWIFDDIYRNSPERIAASEAGRQGAQTRQGGPLEEQLRRVAGNIEKLDPVENSFYQNDFERATDFLENSGLNDEEKRLAQQIAQDKIVLAYEKIARSSRGAPFRTEGRDQIAKRLTEVLAELRAEELAQAKDKALSSIYGDVRGSKEIRSAQTRVNRLTGKALGSVRQQSPERSLEKLGTSQRSLTKNPNEVQKQAFEDLENFLEGQALSGKSREDIEKQILGRIEKGTAGMLNKAKTILEKEFTDGLKGRERGEVVRAINQVADRYRRLGRFNPIGIATRAAFSAKRSIRRDAANSPIERGAQAPQGTKAKPPEAIGQRDQAGDIQKSGTEDVSDSPFEQLAKKEEKANKPKGDPIEAREEGRDRILQLADEDLEVVLRNRAFLENEQGETVYGQKSRLKAAQRRRALEIERFISGELNYEDIYPNAPRGGDAAVTDGAVTAGRTSPGEVLSGASRSVARGTARTSGQRGSDRVGGSDQGAAGTVQTAPVQRDGGSGVPAPLDPQAVRARARATTRRFVQSFARLTDAELTSLSDAELDRARQAILNERDPAEASADRVAIGSTAASVADLARRSGLDLLRGAAAELATEQANRDAVNAARDNLGSLLRSGAFADASTFLDRVAVSGSMPRDVSLRAREFVKLARRGLNFNNVGIQIGRFGPDTSWAGLTTGSGGAYNISINLDAVHDRDSAVNTMLHELQHVVLKEKVARRIPLNRVEQEALDRLEGIRRETVIRAARDRKLNVPDQPTDADVARLTKELVDLSDPALGLDADRSLASLENLDEFVVEVSSNPELADLMVRLGFGEGKGKVTMLGALRNAWDALVQFITGVKADPNSPLAKAFKDSWMVTFANSGADLNLGDYTIPEVRRTAMADELAKLAEIQSFIDARIEQENLAGTTEERNRFLAEWSSLNSNPKTAPARKARKQAAKKQKAQAKQAAEPEKKAEPTPPKKVETKKVEEKKSETPKKVETKKETPPKPPEVKKAVKTAKTKTIKPQTPSAEENEFTEAWKTLSEDEWVKWLKQNGYALGDDADYARLVYRTKRRNNNVTTDQGARDTVQVSQSRARGRVSPKAAGRALLRLAEQRGQALFQLPATLSDTESLLEVMGSTGQPFSLVALGGSNESNPENFFIGSQNALEVGAPAFFETEDGYQKTVITAITPKTVGVRLSDGSETFMPKGKVVTGRGWVGLSKRGRWMMSSKRGSIDKIAYSISSDQGNDWPIVNSRELYQGIYQWAHNTGQLIVPDAVTSWAGSYRRNAHQISSALRNKSAEHLLPTADQLGRMFPEINASPFAFDKESGGAIEKTNPEFLNAWNDLGTEEKIAALARAEISYVEQAIPELVSMVYDRRTDSFKDLDQGRSLDRNQARERLGELITRQEGREDLAEPERVGEATLVRYIAEKAALEGRLGNGSTRDGAESSLDQIAYSRARGRVWRSTTRNTPTGGKITQGGMFAVDELLDKQAGDKYRASRMAIKADIAVIQELSRLLQRQMKTFYKGETPPLETINTALGNLENPLTSQQILEIEQMRASGQTNQAAKKRDQYIRENRRNFKQTKQPQALAQLPEELAATIREMSAHIESLSRRLPNEGLVNGDLAITVDEALGTYLNRSYAIFDDPQWSDRVRKNAKVMDAARKYIHVSLARNKAAELIDDAAAEGRTLSRADAESMANASITEEEVEGILEGYLAVGQEAPTIEVLSGRVPGQKNLSMFYKRGNIAPEIQALWGRYEDPSVNYAKTVMKLSSVIANDNFLKELRDLGIQEGWLWSAKNNPDDTRHPPGYVRISTENNPTLAPLGGMYAHPMLAEGLFKMFPVGSTEEHYWWLRSAMKLTGISMATKTVGSVASQIRNYLGNYLNLVATGNLGLRDIASGDFSRRFGNSTDTVLANTFNKYRNMSRAEWRVKIDDYIRRGIVGESITTGLLEDLLTASRKAGSPDFGDVVWNKVAEPFKKVADFATRTYSAGDDWFKVMIYESEQDKYRQAYPDWDDNKVKEKAAEIARDIHWTYSLAPAIVQDLKKFPFVAPFVTFTSEVIRTTYNLMKLANQEITEGRASGNKELEAIGWKRVRGMATAAFLPAAVGSAAMAMAGISGEDEEDLRRFLPDWQKNSQLLLFRKENGEVDFVDISFLDPYEYFKKPLVAFTRSLRNADSADEILLQGTMSMVRQALDPFTSEQIFAGAIMDVMRNRDAAGRQVYNPQDTGANIGLNVARKIFYDPFVPGTVNSAERIGKAAFGIESETGRAYNLFNEIGSVVAGQRVSSVDAQQALQFKSSRFMREMRDASALFNREFTAQGTRSAGDVIDGYERSNAARRSLIDAIRKDYLAAIRLGVPVQRAKAILRDGGLGKDTLKMVTTGIYKPYDASEQSIDLVRSRGKNDRVSAYNQARRSAAPREVLAD